MRAYLLSILFLFTLGLCMGQSSYSDDFESFAVGDYICAMSDQWRTWSGNGDGTVEDIPVTDAYAASGEKSLAIISGGDAGPADVLLDFGQKYETGQFTYSMNMFIPSGKNGYFNFQGEEAPGITWSMNAQFRANGQLEVDDTNTLWVIGSYPQGEWFNLMVDVNLTSNLWKIIVNGECIGSYTSSNNFLATMDLFPIDGDSEYYVDDVAYNYDENAEEVSFEFDAAVGAQVDVNRGFSSLFGKVGTEKTINAQILNTGVQEITSFSVEMTTSGNTTSQQFTGISIMPGAAEAFPLDESVTLANGANDVALIITEVNGQSPDENQCNDVIRFALTGFAPAEGKKVWLEEGTGTWCTFCPRGDVAMNYMAEQYPETFVGIAVHNFNPNSSHPADPMYYEPWDTGVRSFNGFTGFPQMIFNRASALGIGAPSSMEIPFVQEVQNPPLVFLENAAAWDEDTRELTVEVKTEFKLPLSGDIRLIVGLTEDGVSGTDPGYSQINAYAGGQLGPMGGYENLPSPVPASEMVYNHVGRHLFTPFEGQQNIFSGETISPGGEIVRSFTVTLPEEWNPKNMHIVSALVIGAGVVQNAGSATIDEAVERGLFTVGTIDVALDSSVDIYPNPFNQIANIRINLETAQEVSMEVTDALGKLVAQRNYGLISGDQIFTFDGSNMQGGIYYIKLRSGDKFTTKKVILAQ